MKRNVLILNMICIALLTLWNCTHTDDLPTAETVDTEDLPTVQTAEVTDITQTTATAGGSILANGANVTVRGVCYSTTNDTPSIDDLHTTDGSGTGDFTSLLSALQENTTYYVRAYAMNGSGVAYGNVVSFTTTGSFTSPFEGVYHGTYEYQNDNTTSIGDINFTSNPSDSSVILMYGGIPLTKVGACSFQNNEALDHITFFGDILSYVYNPITEQIIEIGISATFEENSVTVLMDFKIELLGTFDTHHSIVRFSGNKM